MSAPITVGRQTMPGAAPRTSTKPAGAPTLPGPMPADAIPLGALLRRAGAAIRAGLPNATWVVAAVAAAKPARGGTSVELVEAEASRADAGVLRAYLPDGVLAAVRQRTGHTVDPMDLVGMTIVVRVAVDLHPRWGVTGRIEALAPGIEASLARRALEATIARLRREGLLDRQKSIPMPRDITRLAVVHPPGAAGWGDIAADLGRWQSAGLLIARSVPTPFEGVDAASGIAAALRRAAEAVAGSRPDLVLMVRGGGPATSLASLDDEAVARAIAALPVPVITGLGHAVDSTLADRVARSCDTPSKALGLVREILLGSARQARADHAAITAAVSVGLDRAAPSLAALERRISADVLRTIVASSETLDRGWSAVRGATEGARERLARQDDSLRRFAADVAAAPPLVIGRTEAELAALLEAVRARARRAGEGAPDGTGHLSAVMARAQSLVTAAEADLTRLGGSIPIVAAALAARSAAEVEVLVDSVRRRARERIDRADTGDRHLATVAAAIADIRRVQEAAIARLHQSIEIAVSRRLDGATAALDRASAILDAADPAAVLARGYSLAMDQHGRPITSVAAATAASTFTLRFGDGEVAVQLIHPRTIN